MHEYYYEKGNTAYVKEENNSLLIKKLSYNIEEILTTENNIEEIREKLIKLEEYRKDYLSAKKSNIKASIFSLIVGILVAYVAILNYNIFMFIAPISLIGLGIGIMVDVVVTSKKQKVLYNKSKEELQYQLISETNKLKDLKTTAIVKNTVLTEPKKINKSESIKKLQRKLELIEIYSNNMKEFTTYYKNNMLNRLVELYEYSDTDIEFTKCLIEENLKTKQDISENKTNNKIKSKTLKK